jgi:Tfp pilus assembly protein PilF
MKRIIFSALMLTALISTGCASQTADLLRQAELSSIHGNNDKALELINQAVSQDPGSVAAYQARAFLYLRMRNQEKAISDLGKLIELDPRSPQHAMTRGLLYSINGNNESARLDFRKACDLNDESGCSFLRQLEAQ